MSKMEENSNNSKNWTYKIIIIVFKMVWFDNAVMHVKDVDGVTNSVDSDQTAP